MVLFEYEGQIVLMKERNARDAKYQVEGKVQKFVDIEGKGMAIDAYCMPDGSPMMHVNLGALANHSKNANARLSMFCEGARPRVFLLATMPISIGEEIVSDYADRRPGVDTFLKK
jgi:hypothetical protein